MQSRISRIGVFFKLTVVSRRAENKINNFTFFQIFRHPFLIPPFYFRRHESNDLIFKIFSYLFIAIYLAPDGTRFWVMLFIHSLKRNIFILRQIAFLSCKKKKAVANPWKSTILRLLCRKWLSGGCYALM